MNQLQLAIKNWRTVLPGMLFVLCSYITLNPSMLSAIFDEKTSKTIFGIASAISGFFAFATSKASNISGNGTALRPAISNDTAPETPSSPINPFTPSPVSTLAVPKADASANKP